MNIQSFSYFILSNFNFLYKNKYKSSLRVLAYHTVENPSIFEKQLQYLQKKFNIISISELQEFFMGKGQLPKNPLLITFDDGDISVFQNAFPLIQKYQVPAVVFIITRLIDSNKTFWCRWVEKVFKQNGKSYAEARKEVNRLKRVSEAERRGYLQNLPNVSSDQLTSHKLGKLIENGIFIGNHTHTHPMINNCTEEQISEEMQKTRQFFQNYGLEGYSVFAYPNGNWDDKSEKILRKNGIKMAFLFDHKINSGKIHPLRISRIRIDADAPLPEFKVKVAGMHSHLMRLKEKVLSRK
jgi:peptidoglycan/xylan/chitin deacetylase (PgdA/CDA1 family)